MEWYRSAFAGDAWHRLHRAYWNERDALATAEFVERLAGLEGPSNILDVPCGIGRLSRALAERGHMVQGVDLTQRLIDDAREHQGAVAGLSFSVGDMRDLPKARDFDACVCWWGSFGYLGDEEDERFVTAIRGAVRDGGALLIEGPVSESLFPAFSRSGVMRFGDIRVLEEREYDVDTGVVHSDWTVVDGADVNRWSASVRIYGWFELRAMLRRQGFASASLHDAATGEAFEMGRGQRPIVRAL